MHTNKQTLNEQGFASLVIALILIIVMSLMTVGFAQLARREQQGALDKQLANQAYDAAESGINDAESDIKNGLLTTASPNSCVHPQLGLTSNQTISRSDGVGYTCLLVNLTPPNISYVDLGAGQDEHLIFSTVAAGGATSANALTISWGCHTGSSCAVNPNFSTPPAAPYNSQVFPALSSWTSHNYPAVLAFSVTPIPSSSFNRTTLINNAFTAFLYPNSSGSGVVRYAFGNTNVPGVTPGDAPIVTAHCSATATPEPCSAQITGLPPSYTQYAIHLINYYQNSDISIDAQSAGTTTLNIADGQALIDVTGQAKEVLKRIQVRVPIGLNGNTVVEPQQAITGQNVCKRLATEPYNPQIPNPTTYNDSAGDSNAPTDCGFGNSNSTPLFPSSDN